MNKSTAIIGFIVMVIIIIILSLVYVYGQVTTLQSGQCISNGTNSTICAIQFLCPKVNQNISISCPQQRCEYNLTCQGTNVLVRNNFTQTTNPIISRTFFKDNQLPIFAVLGGIIVLIAWKNGWLNKIRPEERDYDQKDRQVSRQSKDAQAGFKELK